MDVNTISGDAFRDALRKSTSPEAIPGLHGPRAEKIRDEQEFIDYHTRDASEELRKKRAQAKLVWSFLENYLITIDRESKENALVESIDVWPDLIAVSGLRHKAVFLVDTSPHQWERIAASRGIDTGDWMHQNNYSDARIQAWSAFNVMRSEVIIDLCDEFRYPYVDIAETGFEKGQEVALNALLNQPVRTLHT